LLLRRHEDIRELEKLIIRVGRRRRHRAGVEGRARLWSRRPPASASAPAPRRPRAEGAGEGVAWPRGLPRRQHRAGGRARPSARLAVSAARAGERNRRERGGKREI